VNAIVNRVQGRLGIPGPSLLVRMITAAQPGSGALKIEGGHHSEKDVLQAGVDRTEERLGLYNVAKSSHWVDDFSHLECISRFLVEIRRLSYGSTGTLLV